MFDPFDPNTPVDTPVIPAATTVLLRDGEAGPEVLMARRNSRLAFAGGAWVFPGGRVDDADHDGGHPTPNDPAAMLRAARRAAVREAAEETGAVVDPDSLVWFAHWTPPLEAPKRFATWFFAGPAPAEIAHLRADGSEIHELAWIRPTDAMARRNAGEIELIPPTWITLHSLTGYGSTAEALADLGSRPPEHFVTRFARTGEAMVALYAGDAGYDSGDPSLPGRRHRLWMLAEGWRYERDPVP